MAERNSHRLCLNAAEGLLQLIVARQEAGDPPVFTVLCSEAWHAPSQGAELLIPALADMLARLGLAAGTIDHIACVRGPGSFTGLRLCLSTAAGLVRSTGAKQAGMEYLPLLAYSACRRMRGIPAASEAALERAFAGQTRQDHAARKAGREERLLWILTHARKNLVHMQGFLIPVSTRPLAPGVFAAPAPFTDIAVCQPHEAACIIRAHWEEENKKNSRSVEFPLLLGSGLRRNYAAFTAAFADSTGKAEAIPCGASTNAPQRPLFLPQDFDHPQPEALLDIAAQLAYSCKDIEALYVRPADAEDNLERIALSLGLDPAKARDKLSALKKSAI
jgi:tRNA threonylcarbamoyl adenosine modification protein YeaZ